MKCVSWIWNLRFRSVSLCYCLWTRNDTATLILQQQHPKTLHLKEEVELPPTFVTKEEVKLLPTFEKFTEFPTPHLLAKAQRDYAALCITHEPEGEDNIPAPFPPPITKAEIIKKTSFNEPDKHALQVPYYFFSEIVFIFVISYKLHLFISNCVCVCVFYVCVPYDMNKPNWKKILIRLGSITGEGNYILPMPFELKWNQKFYH